MVGRKGNGIGTQPSGSGSSSNTRSLHRETDNNVAIFPTQLSNVAAPGSSNSSPPIIVPFPEAEFEDCSSFIDLHLLKKYLERSKALPSSNFLVSLDSDDDDDEVTFVSMTNGKRKASSPQQIQPLKRLKGDSITASSIVCRFKVLLQSEKGRKDLVAIQGAKSGSVLSEISELHIVERPGVMDEDSWLGKGLQVYDSQKNLVATLPIVDTDKVPISRLPHRFTNGNWLEAAVGLCSGKVGDDTTAITMEASLVLGEPSQGLSGIDTSHISIELRLSLDLPMDAYNPTASSSPPWIADHLHRLIRFCFPDDDAEKEIRSHTEVSASLIYSLLPSSRLPALDELQPSELNPSLFPFQKRSVNLLLGREGKRVKHVEVEGKVVLEDVEGIMGHSGPQKLGLWWQEIDESLYYNPLYGKLTRKIGDTQTENILGGILAEEMGLGKTVEVLALILLNPDESRSTLPSYYDYEQEIDITPSKATLIVAPENLRQQWIDEIALHAPELRTFSYLGYREASNHIPKGRNWSEYSKQFDVIVASFDTLKKEINVAKKEPARSRRFERKYERPRSLLIQLAFHRVVMDEVQLVGHSYAAETVSMIDRKYSLAVSGTPVKTINDLKSLFHFLRILNPAKVRHWDRLRSPALLPSLAQCFSMLATRHTKIQVRSEMTLPPQTRVLVPVSFTAIETAFYKDIYSRALQALGIDPTDFASSRDLVNNVQNRFYEDMSQLRSTLLSLRQACTHPQIAGSHVRGSGNYIGGTALATSNTIRSMDEVLTIMIEGTKADQANLWLGLARKRINRMALLLQDKSNEARLEIAKGTLSTLVESIEAKMIGVEEDMKRARYIGPLYKFDRSEVDATERAMSEMESGAVNELSQLNPVTNATSTQAEREKEHEMAEKRIHRSRHMQVVTSRWRFFTEQLHRAHHFLGNVYFQMGEAQKAKEIGLAKEARDQAETDETETAQEGKGDAVSSEVVALKKLENDAYDRAEETRVRLLSLSRKVVTNALQPLETSPVNFDLNEMLSFVDLGRSGITTEGIFDSFEWMQETLNRQAELLFNWRHQILDRLRKPVSRDVSDEDENDDQYQENLDAQAEAEALTEMYRMVLNQREFLLTAVRIEGSTSKPALFVELERHFRMKSRLGFLMLTDPENEAVRRQLDNTPTEQQEEAMKLQLVHLEKLDQEQKDVFFDDVSGTEEEMIGDDEGEEGSSQEEEGDADEGDGDVEVSTLRHKKKTMRSSTEMEGTETAFAASTERAARRKQDSQQNKMNVAMDESRALEALIRQLRDKIQAQGGGHEVTIARMAIDRIRLIINDQKSMCDKLKREHLLFMSLFNARSAYFKHIQELSDDVSDIATSNIVKDMTVLQDEEVALKGREEAVAGRLRYLTAIEEEEGDGSVDGSTKEAASRTCFICTEPLIKAVIFNTCGHSTCENCFKSWTMKRGQCPMCKTRVPLKDVYRVTYGADGKGKKRQVQVPQAEKRKRQQLRYNVLSEDLARSLSVMPIRSALGSKLDLLTRHLLYLEHTKPGTKSLIFTAFSRGINLVGDALRLNNIKYVSMDQGGVRGGRIIDQFKNDASINVLLLHSEAQSSGLNLNGCENVFLLEPLVNHSIELQAIGRVHRIGQSKETTVFIYQVNDTVEERVVELAAQRGQSLVTKENCISQDLKDSAEMIAKTHEGKARTMRAKEGEFVASIEELVRCLFEEQEEEVVESVQRSSSSSSSLSSPIKVEEEERERMRRERVLAIERRQAMQSLARERQEQQQ